MQYPYAFVLKRCELSSVGLNRVDPISAVAPRLVHKSVHNLVESRWTPGPQFAEPFKDRQLGSHTLSGPPRHRRAPGHTSSNTPPMANRGVASPAPNHSTTSTPELLWSPCQDTPEATPPSPSMPVTAGSFIAAMPSTTQARSMGKSRVPLHPARPRVVLAIDRKQVHDNHERLAELHRRQEPDLLVVCSHNPTLFAHARDCA